MARIKKSDFVNAGDRIRALPTERKHRIEALMAEISSKSPVDEVAG